MLRIFSRHLLDYKDYSKKGELFQLTKEMTALKSRPAIEAEEEPPGCTRTPIELDEEPPSTQLTYKNRFFSKVPEKDWLDWKWHFRNRITTVEELAKYLPISPNEQTQIKLVAAKYPLAITPYYLSLINPLDKNDPIRKQAVPCYQEMAQGNMGSEDPLEEKRDSVVPGLVQRYPDRVLMVLTDVCPMLCRHCTRKREWQYGSWVRTPEEIDALMKKLGKPMGHFELLDFAGIDVSCNARNYFAKAVSPDLAPFKLMKAKVQAGEYGKKTGRGFYDWSKGRPEIDLRKATDKVDPKDILAVQINEATKLIEWGIATPEDIDKAILNGTGNTKGPMEEAQQFTPEDLTARLERLSKEFKKKIFEPTRMIREGEYLKS